MDAKTKKQLLEFIDQELSKRVEEYRKVLDAITDPEIKAQAREECNSEYFCLMTSKWIASGDEKDKPRIVKSLVDVEQFLKAWISAMQANATVDTAHMVGYRIKLVQALLEEIKVKTTPANGPTLFSVPALFLFILSMAFLQCTTSLPTEPIQEGSVQGKWYYYMPFDRSDWRYEFDTLTGVASFYELAPGGLTTEYYQELDFSIDQDTIKFLFSDGTPAIQWTFIIVGDSLMHVQKHDVQIGADIVLKRL